MDAVLLCCRRLIFVPLVAASVVPYVHAGKGIVIRNKLGPSYDHIPITPKTWHEVDLHYTTTIHAKQYTNEIKLLRPNKWLRHHQMTQIGHHIKLSIPEFGVVQVCAVITAFKPTHVDTLHVDKSTLSRSPIIGKFKRYVVDVRTYRFMDGRGRSSHVSATPNHLFYVKNKRSFVPITDITKHNQLLGMNVSSSEIVHLVCANGQNMHCGMPYGHKKPVIVYNLEVYRKHVYRIGTNGLVVHNTCGFTENGITYLKEKIAQVREVYPKGGCGIFAICAARNISPLQVVTDGDPYGGMYTSEATGQLGTSTSLWGSTVNLRTLADLRDYFGQMMGENDVRYVDMEGVLGQDIYNMKKGMRSGHIALLVKKGNKLVYIDSHLFEMDEDLHTFGWSSYARTAAIFDPDSIKITYSKPLSRKYALRLLVSVDDTEII